MIYIVGSLRNPRIPEIANSWRAEGLEVFDDWYSPGPETDDRWQEYERARGRTYAEALAGYHAQEVFDFDKRHLSKASTVVLVLPAGKSGHLELGWALGQGKTGYILLDGEPERFDIMYCFADGVFSDLDALTKKLLIGVPAKDFRSGNLCGAKAYNQYDDHNPYDDYYISSRNW